MAAHRPFGSENGSSFLIYLALFCVGSFIYFIVTDFITEVKEERIEGRSASDSDGTYSPSAPYRPKQPMGQRVRF